MPERLPTLGDRQGNTRYGHGSLVQKYAVYKTVCGFYRAVDYGRIDPARERELRALGRTVDYIEREMPDALGLDGKREIIDHALGAVARDGHYLEFGVFAGGTISYMAKRVGSRTIHGFDSLKGLPESRSGFNLAARAFDRNGKLPRVPSNVRLHPGWFDATLPPWLDANPGPVAFIHVDCDLYSSTKTIFKLLGPRIVAGTVILFDEYFNYPNWERHEHKAFSEFVAERGIKSTALAYARHNCWCASTRLDKRNLARTEQSEIRSKNPQT